MGDVMSFALRLRELDARGRVESASCRRAWAKNRRTGFDYQCFFHRRRMGRYIYMYACGRSCMGAFSYLSVSVGDRRVGEASTYLINACHSLSRERYAQALTRSPSPDIETASHDIGMGCRASVRASHSATYYSSRPRDHGSEARPKHTGPSERVNFASLCIIIVRRKRRLGERRSVSLSHARSSLCSQTYECHMSHAKCEAGVSSDAKQDSAWAYALSMERGVI
jgi:hypothetical protein